MDTPSVYSGIVSPRSHRLRTIGLVLLTTVCAMALYGYFGLMPSIERSLREKPVLPSTLSAGPPAAHPLTENPPTPKAQRAHKLQVAVALAYWGVCAALLVGVVLVAWLDFREVARVYVAQRRAMWSQTAGAIENQTPDDSP